MKNLPTKNRDPIIAKSTYVTTASPPDKRRRAVPRYARDIVGSIPPRLESTAVRDAAKAVVAALRAFPDRGMIVGSIAAIAHGVDGRARHVDATLATARELHLVFFDLERYALVPRVHDALEFARRCQVLLLRHSPSGVDVDLSLAWLPFELDALAAAEDLLLGSVELTVARPEDLVIYAAATWSPDDRANAERLVALHGATMDLDRIRRVVTGLAEAASDPDRIREVESMIGRALSA